jgi:radical SAM superfamily enzyme YgiQ (UPF0313 family)
MTFSVSCSTGGVPIVLTASAVEMSDFNLDPFIAFEAGLPLGFLPKSFLRKHVSPPIKNNIDGTAGFAPYGLRKVETLLAREFGAANVVTVHPSRLAEFVGPRTRVIGISTMDPTGHGFVSRTLSGIMGLRGTSATAMEFETLIASVTSVKGSARVVVGGAGAWQLLQDGSVRRNGIDTVVTGQSEKSVVEVFREALDGNPLDKVVEMVQPDMGDIPTITAPSIYGTVEVTRGCGRGCHFCSPTMSRLISFPQEHILREVKLNASSGSRMIVLQTDDLFLYQTKPGFHHNRTAIIDLVNKVAETDGVEFIQIAHASLPPVALDPGMIRDIAPALVEKSIWDYRGTRCATVEIGLETGSVRLVGQHMRGKPLPYEPESWPDIAVEAIGTLNENGICPLATLVLGLPGETEADVEDTLKLIDRLKDARLFYVPLLFVSECGTALDGRKHMDIGQLSPAQWEVLAVCWRQNIERWEPAFSLPASLVSSLPYRARLRALIVFYSISKAMERRGRNRRLRAPAITG